MPHLNLTERNFHFYSITSINYYTSGKTQNDACCTVAMATILFSGLFHARLTFSFFDQTLFTSNGLVRKHRATWVLRAFQLRLRAVLLFSFFPHITQAKAPSKFCKSEKRVRRDWLPRSLDQSHATLDLSHATEVRKRKRLLAV